MKNITKYPDGSSYAEVNALTSTFTFRVNSYEDLWHLNQVVDAYNYRYKSKPNVLIPNLIDAQADRRFKGNQSHGLKLVCEFLNNMGANFAIFHPHNKEVVEALIDNVTILDNADYITNVFKEVSNNYPMNIDDDLILMSPDAGGFKPLMQLCQKINWQGETYSASKARLTGGTIIQNVGRSDFGGKDILIVDDICVRGGTFIGLSKILKERNIGKLFLAVSHMTLEIVKPELLDAFDGVFTTNSKYDNYFVPTKEGGTSSDKLTVINLF